jgi:uridine kinase
MKYPFIIEKIKELKPEHDVTLIGIDGVGGSGKTSLAKYIKENIPNTNIIQMDDFYSPSLQRADLDRVEKEVLIPLSNSKPIIYKIYDWKNDSYINSQTIEPEGLIIVEGVYSIHPQLKAYYDLRILMDCSPAIGFKRGIERDKICDGVDNTEKWLNIWMPKEVEYFQREKPFSYADYILRNN